MEVEAAKDTQKLLESTVILLDQPGHDLNDVVNTILHKLLDEVEPPCSFDDAKSALFTHDAGMRPCNSILCLSNFLILASSNC